MASFDPMSNIVIAENPWRDTAFGQSSHYIRRKNREPPSDDQLSQQQDFADARETVADDGECSSKDGMARAVCIAMEMHNELS